MSKITKDRPRLGRGLSSLISVNIPPAPQEDRSSVAAVMQEIPALPAPPVAAPQRPFEIPLAEIHPNPHQPRRQFLNASLQELAASLRSTGLIQPIIVRKVEDGYELIAGERRWRAAKLAGLAAIPAIVREADAFSQAQMALVENIHREDLNPLDRAQAYRALMDQLGLTQSELAARLGEDRSSIANFLRLLELTESVRERVSSGTISVGHAKILAGISDPMEQERLAALVVAQGLSVRNLERIIAEVPPTPIERRAPGVSAHLLDLEKTLARELGMRVQLRSTSSKGHGKLIIHYASLDQFDDLVGRMGIKLEG